MPTVADIVRLLEDWFPLSLAAEWDNVGLLLGDAAAPVERVMTCLTVTAESAAEAIRERANLIVSHHPILFRPVKSLTSRGEGEFLLPLVRNTIAVYSPHTAFDNAHGGINDDLASRLGLVKARPLRGQSAGDRLKIAVFVPDADLTRVSDALFAAGAGVIGAYRECSFRIKGTGTFFGGDASQPAIGQKGRREEVDEWRLEVVCPRSRLAAAVEALRSAHSYEEPAFDIYPLEPAPTSAVGAGRVGKLETPMPLSEFVARVRNALPCPTLQVVGDDDKKIETVALACGAAGEFLTDALRAGADAFLTGELRFHDALHARGRGLAVLVAGHHATERPAVEALADRLSRSFAGVKVWPSRDESDPLRRPSEAER